MCELGQVIFEKKHTLHLNVHSSGMIQSNGVNSMDVLCQKVSIMTMGESENFSRNVFCCIRYLFISDDIQYMIIGFQVGKSSK